MATTADVVIVGGGVMGCSILHALAVRGTANTVLIEQGVLASGSTGRSQGILRMHYSNEVTTRMARESLRVFREFDETVGGSSGFVKAGYLLIADGKDREALRANVAMQRRAGVNTEVVDAEQASAISPEIVVDGGELCAYEPESGYADPYLVTHAYATRAREMGASVRMNTTVTGVEISGDRVTGVTTPGGLVSTGAVVMAAGPWSRRLLERVGLELPLETVRHQVMMFQRPNRPVPGHAVIGDVVNSLSARPEGTGLTFAAVGEDEPAGPDDYNQGVDMHVVQDVMTKLSTRMPAMSEAVYRGGWSGLFTTTPDWTPSSTGSTKSRGSTWLWVSAATASSWHPWSGSQWPRSYSTAAPPRSTSRTSGCRGSARTGR